MTGLARLRRMAQVAARRVDSTKSIPDEPVARTARSTRGRGAKRPASSLQSHPLSDCDSDFDAEEELIEQDSGTDGCSSDEEPSTKRSKASKGKGSTGAKASSKRVRVVRSTAGPAAVAKGTGLNRAYTKEERERMAAAKRANHNQGTVRAYATTWAVWTRWLAKGGYEEGQQPCELDISTPTPEVIGAFARFLEWYAAGRKGDPQVARKGGRKAAEGSLASMNGVHAALQFHVSEACFIQGTRDYKLAEQADYKSAYQLYCKKSAARSSSQDGSVHLSMTADDLTNMCHKLLASDDKDDMRNLAMILYQFSTVSRGDDVRPRKLSELMVRYLNGVGPSKCPSIAVMQHDGKTLKNKPAWKAFIRNRMPECCPVRAVFAWLCCQFCLNSEPLPMPGDDLYLFPGSKEGEMSLANHARIIQAIFDLVGISPPKVTHEFRVFGAQALHDHGVALEVIQRIGHWLLDPFGTAYIVPGFTPEALLALAFWPGAAQKDFSGYWAERFHVSVPSALVQRLLPGLDRLEAAAAELADKAKGDKASRADKDAASSAKHLLQVLKMGAVVVVQDALELAEEFPDNPLHALLLGEKAFRTLLKQYKTFKGLGGFEDQRPLSVQQRLQQLDQKLDRLFGGQVLRSAKPPAMSAQVWQQQQQQRQQHGSSRSSSDQQAFEELAEELQAYAKGTAQLPPQQQLINAQQASQVLSELQRKGGDGLPYKDWDTADDDDDQQQLQQQAEGAAGGSEGTSAAANAAAAAAAADPAAAAAAAAASSGPAHSTRRRRAAGAGSSNLAADTAAAGAGSSSHAADTAAAAAAGGAGSSSLASRGAAGEAGSSRAAGLQAAGTPPRQQMPAMQQSGEAPLSGEFMTPSGQQYSSQQLRARHIGTTTPGGHYTTFFSMQSGGQQPAGHMSQQMQQQQQGRAPAGFAAGGQLQLQLQQQLQAVAAHTQALQRDQQETQQDLSELQQAMQGVQDQQLLSSMQEQEQELLQRQQDISTKLAEQQLQKSQLRVQLRNQQQQQQQQPATCVAPTGLGHMTGGEGLLSRMGATIDPVNAIMHPYTAERGISLAAFESVPLVQQVGGAVPAAAVVEALMELKQQMQQLSVQVGSSGGAGSAGTTAANISSSFSKRAGAEEHSQPGAAAAAAAGAEPATANKQRGSSSSGSGSRSQEFAFPNFGTKSVEQAAKWYHETPLADHLTAKDGEDCKGWTPAQMQQARKDNWRGGTRGPRFQRWAEWVQLMQYLDAKRLAMSAPRSGVVGPKAAAEELDRERGAASLTQFYKQTVVPWAAQQQHKKQQQQEQSEGEEEGPSDMGVDEEEA